MKAILLGAVLATAMPAGAVVLGNPADPAQSILQRDQLRLLGGVQDWGDYLKKLSPEIQNQYGPELAQIKTDGDDAGSVEQFRPVQLRLEAWKQSLLYQLFPTLSGFAATSDSARLAQAQVEAFRAVEKLKASAFQSDRKAYFDGLKARISLVSDAPSLDRLFDNAGLSRPAPLPQAVFAGYYSPSGNRSWSGLAAAQPKGLKVNEVPSPLSLDAADRARYAKVIDYLRGRGASQKIIDMTISEAVRQGVDPLLVLALVQNESGFHAGATSPVGARGLMQVMPATGRGLGVKDADALYDPSVNLRAGISYLKSMWGKFTDFSWSALAGMNPFASSDVKKVVASYNAGPGAVQKYGGVPPYRETMNYVKKVLDTYLHLRGLFGS